MRRTTSAEAKDKQVKTYRKRWQKPSPKHEKTAPGDHLSRQPSPKSLLAASWRPFLRFLGAILAPRGPGSSPRGVKIIRRPEPGGTQGAQGLPGAPREASGRQFGSNFGASGRGFRHFSHLRMPPGSSFATLFCSTPYVANKALQKTTRRNTRSKELEKFSQAG